MAASYRRSSLNSFIRLVCLGIAIFFSMRLLQTALPDYLPKDWSAAHEGDALSDWKAARIFRLPVTPYSSDGLALISEVYMGHPPTTPFWYLPLMDSPKAIAAELTSLLLWALLIPHIYCCARALKWPAPEAVTILGTSLVLSTTWSAYHFQVVQLSEPIAFLYLLGWLFLRRGKDTYAGVSLGAAATFKLFPGLMLVFLLLARRWRAFFAGTVTYLLIAGVMTRAYGLQSWLFFTKQQKPIADQWIGSLQNSSVYGLVNRFLFPFCKADAHPSKLGTLITVFGSAALVVTAAIVSRRSLKAAREADLRAIDLPYTVFALLSVFLNAWVWEHYYVFAIQPIFVLATVYGSAWRSSLRAWCDGAARTRSLLLTSATSFAGYAGVGFVLYALSIDHWLKGQLVAHWKATHDSAIHRLAHFVDALNFVPWVVPILLCLLTLGLARRRTYES